MTTIKDEVLSVKEELKEAQKQVKQNSFAVEILREEKQRNERLNNVVKKIFIIWLITFLAFIGLLGYTLWLKSDIGTEEITETTTKTYEQTIDDTGDINQSNIVNGGDING